MRVSSVWRSSLGWMGAVTDDEAVVRVLVLPRRGRGEVMSAIERPLFPKDPPPGLAEAVEEYFGGGALRLPLPGEPDRGTPFQRRVWETVRRIPQGEVMTYGQVAREAGHPHACRAVGQAVGANPLPLYVP